MKNSQWTKNPSYIQKESMNKCNKEQVIYTVSWSFRTPPSSINHIPVGGSTKHPYPTK